MNKSKMILAVTGGVVGVAALAMAYFVWDAYATKSAALEGNDEEDGLESVIEKARTLSGKPVFPGAESVKAIESNAMRVAAWKDEAFKLAAAGDRVYEKTTPAAFKTFMVADAKRLAALPGGVGGVLVKPEFAFGPFKDYIAEGKMPAEANLAELQRRWDDVATVTEALAKSGISELVDVQFAAQAAEKDEADNRKQKKGKKAKAEPSVRPPASYSYVFTFMTRPSGFVKAINALETSPRFISVDGFTFGRERDVLNEALGGGEKKNEAAQGGGGRRGRRRAQVVVQVDEKSDAEGKNRIITDPLLDDPFKAVVSVTICDFRSLEETEKSEEVKK